MAIICIPILYRNHVNSVDAYKILKDKRFVFVQNQYDLMQNGHQGAGFDLQAENLFVSYSTVIKNNKLYGKSGVYTTKGFYERALNGGVSSILLNLKVTPEEIEKHHFQIERDPESLVNKVTKVIAEGEESCSINIVRKINSLKFVSPTTKNSYQPKLSGITKVKKASNGILGSYILTRSKTKLTLIRGWIKKLKLLKKFKRKTRVINLLLN